MARLAIIATIEVDPVARKELIPILQRHRERCLRDEPGTIAFEVLVPDQQQDQLLLYERYVDRGAFDAHWNGASLATAKAEAGAALKKISGIFCTPA